VWASFISQKVEGLTTGGSSPVALGDDRATAFDIGTTVNVAGFGLTAYYGEGVGLGTTLQLRDGFDSTGKARDSEDWYLQATYALPTATKIGVSYGQSTLDGNSGTDTFDEYQNTMWTVGAYHPITKHLNLVAEYSDVKTEIDSANGKSKTVSLGAILFF
jgi:hypothetical protein